MHSISEDSRKVCFVVMGFGRKTDFQTGRTLDLDATYESIISPAAEAAGLRCMRADDVKHSGVIDSRMYELLLRAELVIADISTANVNAIYELGVRHALCPNTTIIMSESGGRLHFDLNHISTFQYTHLGDDIGSRESVRARRALEELIKAALESGETDSPVYTYLPGLQKPLMNGERYQQVLEETEVAQEKLSEFLHKGEEAHRNGQHADAVKAYECALRMKTNDTFIVQRLAFATYKAQSPSALDALMRARAIIDALDPEVSNDPETLGIAGAIRKRLWIQTDDRTQLDTAIRYYRRGFEIRRDYYNGENLATCLALRARIQSEPAEEQFDLMSAKKVRQLLIELLTGLIDDPSFGDRSDQKWIYATLSQCSFALGDNESGERYEQRFLDENPADWEVKTFTETKALLERAATT